MTARGTKTDLPSDKITAHEFMPDIVSIVGNPSVQTMLETVCLATGLRFAAIARVTDQRWITCSAVDYLEFGLTPGDELIVESTICHEVRHHQSEVIINDAMCDVTYRDHHTPSQYGFRSYLSIPIHRPDGRFFGTLCALDPEPNQLDDIRTLKMVRLFAKLIGDSLQSEELHEVTTAALTQARAQSELQEHYLAILAHDLRNPVSAIRGGLRMLAKRLDDPGAVELVALIDASALRVADLVTNLMDQARSRLTGGIVLARRDVDNLRETLEQIVSEFRTIAPDQEIQTNIDIPKSFNCDSARMAQLFSNLLGNALTHGAEDRPVIVSAHLADNALKLSVSNEGEPIPEDLLPMLFDPFTSGRKQGTGLGLGLYIASEIAKGHGGSLAVTSNDDATVFTLEVPFLASTI